jgi:hypothetical protein
MRMALLVIHRKCPKLPWLSPKKLRDCSIRDAKSATRHTAFIVDQGYAVVVVDFEVICGILCAVRAYNFPTGRRTLWHNGFGCFRSRCHLS